MRTSWLAALVILAAFSITSGQFRRGGRFHGSFGGKSYYYSWRATPGLAVGWHQANRICRGLGMGLVSLDSPAEANYVRSLVGQNRLQFLWTSGRRSGRSWVWSSTGRPFTFSQWSHTGGFGRPQPDNREGNEVCMGILNNFYGDGITWHDIACHHRKPFICQSHGFSG